MIVYKFILQEEYNKIEELEFRSFPELNSNFKLIDNFGYAVQECVTYSGDYCTCGYILEFEIDENLITPYLSIIDYGDFIIKNYDCPFDLDINNNLLSDLKLKHIHAF